MKRRRKRKDCIAKHFHPDPRNVRHQKYCSKAQCRKASKAASQHRWLNKKAKNIFSWAGKCSTGPSLATDPSRILEFKWALNEFCVTR